MAGASLFAGLDSHGNIQFVGDVERGLASACHCVTCKSPLVAKKGDVREWHFAHIGGQERPECVVGAINLLRRLAIEQLSARQHLTMPFYKETVRVGSGFEALSETVEWLPAGTARAVWDFEPAKDAPAARIELLDGTGLALYVDVTEARPARVRRLPEPGNQAELVYWLPVPAPGQLVTGEAAIEFVRGKGEFHWLHHPDISGKLEAARQRLTKRWQSFQPAVRRVDQQPAAQAGQRWHAIRAQMQDRPPATSNIIQPGNQVPAQIQEPPWWIWRKPQSSMIFYGLKDGSGWLIVQHLDGRYVLLPWPQPEEGWDEAMPVSLGAVDQTLQGIILRDLTSAMVYLGGKLALLRNGSSLADLQAIPWPPKAPN